MTGLPIVNVNNNCSTGERRALRSIDNDPLTRLPGSSALYLAAKHVAGGEFVRLPCLFSCTVDCQAWLIASWL